MLRWSTVGLLLMTPLAACAAAYAAGLGWGLAVEARRRWGWRGLVAGASAALFFAGSCMVWLGR